MRTPSFDARLYRAGLRLYPAAFREEFLEQIARDFDDARGDVAAAGRGRDLLMFWLLMAGDLTRSVVVQWVRTGWPVITIIAVAASCTQIAMLARFWRPNLFPMQPLSENEDVVVVLMLVAVVFVVIAATIVGTIWLGRSIRRPRVRRR